MKKLFIVCAAIAMMSACQNTNADILIGGAVGNGDFQFNFNNNVITDPVAWGIGSRNAADTADIAMTSNATGRAFQPSSQLAATFRPNSWIATRTAYPGGNNAWGFDSGNGAFGSPNVYYFMNSGDSTLVHTAVNGTFNAGDKLQLKMDLFQQGTTAGPLMNATGTVTYGVSGTNSFNMATPTANQTLLNFTSNEITLTESASSIVFSIAFSTGTSGNQSLMDNVVLERTFINAVPEPGSLLAIGFGVLGLSLRRRK